MFERMLNKDNPPTMEQIETTIGADGFERLLRIEALLKDRYRLTRELKFPFGLSYGWGFKYSHNKKHLFYLFFEKCAVTATIQIGGSEADRLTGRLDTFSEKARELWENRYPCGRGGWIHYRILSDNDLTDVMELIAVKKSTVKTR